MMDQEIETAENAAKAKKAGRGKAGGKARAKAAPKAKAPKAAKNKGPAKVTFNLEPEVLALAKQEARKEGRELGHFLQKAIEGWLMANVPADDALAQRLAAKRQVIDRTVSLAQDLDGKGKFDEHFILTVMKTAAADKGYAELYDKAVAAEAGKGVDGRKARLNRQLGRMIISASKAQAKKSEDGKALRAQVTDEVIRTYTLLEKAA